MSTASVNSDNKREIGNPHFCFLTIISGLMVRLQSLNYITIKRKINKYERQHLLTITKCKRVVD